MDCEMRKVLPFRAMRVWYSGSTPYRESVLYVVDEARHDNLISLSWAGHCACGFPEFTSCNDGGRSPFRKVKVPRAARGGEGMRSWIRSRRARANLTGKSATAKRFLLLPDAPQGPGPLGFGRVPPGYPEFQMREAHDSQQRGTKATKPKIRSPAASSQPASNQPATSQHPVHLDPH